MKTKLLLIIGLALLVLVPPAVFGQGPTGSLTGIVQDETKAVVPGADVVLKNEATNAVRRTVSNDEGFFSIQAIPAGTYTVTVQMSGFGSWEKTGVVVHPGDRLNLGDVTVKVAGTAEQLTVSASPEMAIPVDSGEKAAVITEKQIQNLSIVGRSGVELLKILPGTVFTGGRYSPTGGEVIAFNEGVGNYNVAGTRNDALDIVSDGANTIDPGCNCGSAVTPNVDMIQEMKIQTSNFSAENNKGPVVIQSVSKSGTSEFHGEMYTYLRHNMFNSKSWEQNRYDLDKPADRFFFPGFNIGGPVIIPGTGFNKNRDKLFFFAGAEWMRQYVDLGAWPSWVPTAKMRDGDFSELVGGNYGFNMYDNQSVPTGDGITNGVINPNLLDPGGKIIANQYPLPNRDPKTNNGFNYISQIVNPQHRNQQLVRVDYNVSDNTKIYTRFNHEGEKQPYPYILWWNQAHQIPYASPVLGENRSFSSSTSLVNVLNPTTTNEVVFAATYINLPNTFEEPDKVDRRKLGYPYKGIFKNEEAVTLMPNVTDWDGGIGHLIQPGGFDPVYYANKWLISANDNFSKVLSTHTLKFGAYYQYTTNDQPTGNNVHGEVAFTNWGGNSTGNAFADMVMGRTGAYNESTKNVIGNMAQNELSFYAQDSWKAARRLTLELGARFYHYGFMYNKDGYIAGFDIAKYQAELNSAPFPGVVANYKGDNISRSGFETPFLNIGPRIGWAYDLTGKGNSVIRGGIGAFYYRDQGNVQFDTIANPPLLRKISIGWNPGTLAQIDEINPDAAGAPKYDLNVLDHTDNDVPVTYSWSFTLSQRIPYSTVIEASYVGNTSRNQVTTDSYNINAVPEGALFLPGTKTLPATVDEDAARPYNKYGLIEMKTHMLSQHYHSLQVTGNRQTGRLNYSASYTFSKATGIAGAFYGSTFDVFDLRRRSYGPLSYDRTHTFAIAYNMLLPDPVSRPVLREILNGWQISGITQFQSGAPLGVSPNGETSVIDPNDPTNDDGSPNYLDIGSNQINGTPDTAARAVVICDPREGLEEGQFVNPRCFAAPTPGNNGMYQIPYLKYPGFQNHDLSIFKNFALNPGNEDQKLQFRFSMYNFPNHPIPAFAGNDMQLQFNGGQLSESTLANFGKPSEKRGKRIIQFALKFMF